MTEICIIRHGETDWNAKFLMQGRSDIPLNDEGRRQARAAACYLKNESWDVIYASTLSRAIETARTIAGAVGIPDIIIEEELIECGFGIAEGISIYERRELYPDRNLIPGAEKLNEVQSRSRKIITEIADRHPGKRVLIVSHGCFIMETIEVFSSGKINGRNMHLKNLSMTLLTRDSDWNIPWYNRSVEQMSETA